MKYIFLFDIMNDQITIQQRIIDVLARTIQKVYHKVLKLRKEKNNEYHRTGVKSSGS